MAGGTAVARSAWSETSFPFLLMLPRGPKEAYLRAPLPSPRLAARPAGRSVAAVFTAFLAPLRAGDAECE